MHPILNDIQKQLEEILTQLGRDIPEGSAIGVAHQNWSFPALSRSELGDEVLSIIDLINENDTDELGDHAELIADYIKRLEFLRNHNIAQIWGNAAQAIPAFLFTLKGLNDALKPILRKDFQAEASQKFKQVSNQLRGMEARLKGLEPRTGSLSTMVERIEQAYHAADQLPADLELLTESREKIFRTLSSSELDKNQISRILEEVSELKIQLENSAADAKGVVEKCQTAYSAATSVGLAAAFSERSETLSKSMWVWVVGLILALSIGSFFGSHRLIALADLLNTPNVSTSLIILNLLFTLLSVGPAIWFSWLSTKQIGQRFRLSEDYAFKASISRAYEGFRREAARFDKEMEAKLLTSALTRLDELPLRVMEKESYGSPWHELASSDSIKKALNAIPGFTEQVKDLANKAVSVVSNSNSNPTTNNTRDDS